MDYHNDQEWQAYYASMMIQKSPDASLSEHSHSISSPDDNHGGIGIHSNVSYETDDDDDEEEEEEETPPPPATKKKRPPKKKRDPNMPKGALTANLLYTNINRARAKEENPDLKFGEIARLLSAEYSALSDYHKALWKKASDDDRLRFKREIQNYTPPLTDNAAGSSSTNQVDTSRESGDYASGDTNDDSMGAPEARKAKKDPSAPKGPRSAWHFFIRSRKQALAEQPHGTAFKIMSHLSGEYKALSEEKRNVFDEMAKQDKRRHNAEMGIAE